jgi:hypothetical protein
MKAKEAITPTSANMIVRRMPPITSGLIAIGRKADINMRHRDVHF